MSAPETALDPVDVITAVMEALRDDLAAGPEIPDAEMPREAETGTAAILTTEPGLLAGLPVAEETFRRVGVRMRALKRDGQPVAADDRIALLGGSLKAILTARRTALAFLVRLSSIASGVAEPDPSSTLDAYAASLRQPTTGAPVGDNGPGFELEVEA